MNLTLDGFIVAIQQLKIDVSILKHLDSRWQGNLFSSCLKIICCINFKKLYDALMNNILVHKHLIVRAEAKNPPMDETVLTEWFKNFIDEIGMKVMMGPYVKYSHMIGNRGITGAAIIETSHIVMHVWDEPDPALLQFDVYSCGEFDPETICE
jgi:S-adenosylmethionine/arginine decarboxylase-like enzyme